METRESEKATKEARAEVTQARRPSPYSEAALRYLREAAYIEAHRPEPQVGRKRDDEPAEDAT